MPAHETSKAAAGDPAAFRVRDAEAGDIDSVVRCVQALNRHHGFGASAFDAAAAARDLFGDDAYLHAVIAEAGDSVIGAALWHVAYETVFAARGAYLSDLWVDPTHRGMGAGRALIGAVAERVRRRGGVYVWWVSQPWNRPAQRFYAQLPASDEVMRSHALIWRDFDRFAEADARARLDISDTEG